MKKLALLVLALGALAPLTASARPYHSTPVRWIVETRDNLNEDDKYVTIIGHVTRRIGDEEYWFTDGTGSVRLDSENFDLPIGRRIVIGGRIDQAYLGFGHIEVDVRKWHYAPLHPATTATHTTAAPTPPPAAAAVPPPASPAPAPAPAVTTTPPPAPAATTTLAPAPEPAATNTASAPAPASQPAATPASQMAPASTNATPAAPSGQ